MTVQLIDRTRTPTARQAASLRAYAAGILPAAGATATPLVRWGWLETLDGTPAERQANGHYPPLRLAAAGWRAIAAALDQGRLQPYDFGTRTHA